MGKTFQNNTCTSTYIHIPFCSEICFYCDFSKVLIDYQPVDDYISTLFQELEQYEIPPQRTIYIGGGTPTALNAQQLKRLLNGIESRIDLSNLQEFTIEANPNDLTDELVEVIANSQINRVSVGVQTFNPKLLRKIGRNHSPEDVNQGIRRLKRSGINNISIDLIYALPHQTIDDLKETLEKAILLDLPHYSIYSLILENQTVFMNQLRRGKLKLADSEVEYQMYQLIRDTLQNAGFKHYEVSNFARPGFESQHNLVYWQNLEYFGFGAGASGYLKGVRYKNHSPIQHYIKGVNAKTARISEEELSLKEIIEEEMFLGLRKSSGVSISKFNSKFSRNFLEIYSEVVDDLRTKELVKLTDDHIKMTEKGLLCGNDVFEAFLLEEDFI